MANSNELNDKLVVDKLVEQDKTLTALLGEEVAYIMEARSDLMSLLALLIEKNVLHSGDVTNAMYEGRQRLIKSIHDAEATKN